VNEIRARASERQALLGAAPLFSGISAGSLQTLAHNSRLLNLRKGEYLFFKTDPADAAFLVRSGWIVINLSNADGRELVIHEMRAGDLFGEQALVGGECRSAGAFAREASEVLEIGRTAFIHTLEAEPIFARRLLEVTVGRLIAANERESALAFHDAPARIAHVLLAQHGVDQRTADRGYITLSQDELAQRTGVARQTVARILGKWREQGWLLTGRGRIMILQLRELQSVENDSAL
jgi:CRP-like cAMP-binding protein